MTGGFEERERPPRDLSPLRGTKGRVGEGDGAGLLIINQKDGGKCQHCGRDARVYWVGPVNKWLCARDVREATPEEVA